MKVFKGLTVLRESVKILASSLTEYASQILISLLADVMTTTGGISCSSLLEAEYLAAFSYIFKVAVAASAASPCLSFLEMLPSRAINHGYAGSTFICRMSPERGNGVALSPCFPSSRNVSLERFSKVACFAYLASAVCSAKALVGSRCAFGKAGK